MDNGFNGLRAEIDGRFARVDARVDRIDDRLDSRFDRIDARIDALQRTMILVFGGMTATLAAGFLGLIATQL